MNLANTQTRPQGHSSPQTIGRKDRVFARMFAGTGLSLAHGRNVQSQDSPLALRALRPRETFIALSGGASEQLLGIAPRQEP